MGDSETERSTFGKWLRQQRRTMDLTQEAFADQVGCARITLRRIESDALKPSKELALILLEKVGIPKSEHVDWLPFTRGLADLPNKQTNPIPIPLRNNLPAFLTTFIGREKEQADVIKLITKHRLVTLTGSGGVGKTRLSIQIATELLSEYPIGVWLVELAPLTDPALVQQSVCAVLGVKPDGNTSAIEALTNYLRSKKILLVMDNCEHLIDACAQLCDALLRSCSELRILASSRESMGIGGEHSYRVPSLSLPNSKNILKIIQKSEAVELFVERATAVLPEFELTEFNASFVAQICQRLDGIALAIELAASRVKMFKVEQIAARLDDAFGLLTSGNRTALPRQQTLRALIDWSYNLLSDEEKIFLRKLSVFMGGWTLEAAEAVCGNKDALELLTHLVDKSLVSVDLEHGEEPRYYLLETIRQFAREKLIEGLEDKATRESHFEYYLKLGEEAKPKMRSAEMLLTQNKFEVEWDNFYAALTWASADGKTHSTEKGLRLANAYCEIYSNEFDKLREILGWLQKGLERSVGTEDEIKLIRAEAMLHAGLIIYSSESLELAHSMISESVALYRANPLSNPRDLAYALEELGELSFTVLGDAEKARSLTNEALTICRSLGNSAQWELATALFMDGWGAYWNKDFTMAWTHGWESKALFEKLGDRYGMVMSLRLCGVVADTQRKYDTAHSLYQEALLIAQEQFLEFPKVTKWLLVTIKVNLAVEDRILGNYQTARETFEDCLSYFLEVEYKGGISDTLQQLGRILLKQGEYELALKSLRKCIAMRAETPSNEYITIFTLADVFRVQGNAIKAAHLLGVLDAKLKSWLPSWLPATVDDYHEIVNNTRAALGEEAFDIAYAEGSSMTMEEAIAYALEESNE